MSSAARNTSKQDKTPELEQEDRQEIDLEETSTYLEPSAEEIEETPASSETENYNTDLYKPKNATKKALAAMGGLSILVGSPAGAAMGIGGAMALDYYGSDPVYSLEKAEELYTKIEDYKERLDS